MTLAQPSVQEAIQQALPLVADEMLRARATTEDRVSRCRESIREFAKHVWLNDPIAGEIPFAMWDWQPGLLELWARERKVCILKARQLGVSWLVAVYVVWVALFRPHSRILLISTDQRESDKLLEKVKFVIRTLPEWLRPPASLMTTNTRLVRFGHLDSEIEALPSTGKVGRSRTASVVILDEHAHQDQDSAIWTAIKPAVERGQVLSISTGNGLGPLHTRLYKAAVSGKGGGFVPVFIPWDAHPDRDEEWREREREEFRLSAEPRMFEQEYPANDVEAFIITGNPVWTAEQLDALSIEDVAPTEPGLWLYRPPDKGSRYVIGADCSEGLPDGDWSSASVIRVWKDDDGYRGEQVAVLRGLWPPEEYAMRLHRLALHYSGDDGVRRVMVGVERNNHGHAVLLRMRQLNPKDKPYSLSAWGNKLGWHTTTTTRPLMYDEYAGAIRLRRVDIHDPGTLSQMSTFASNARGGEAQSGFHDDDVTAMAIGWQHHRRAFGVVLDVSPSAR